MPQCITFILFWKDTTCFGRRFRPSSGVQDCTYSNRHLSNIYCCLLASGYPLASYVGAYSWFYCRNNITMHGPINVKKKHFLIFGERRESVSPLHTLLSAFEIHSKYACTTYQLRRAKIVDILKPLLTNVVISRNCN